MSGFFKVDVDDFDEIWTDKQNRELFLLYATLLRNAWRQDSPKTSIERRFEIKLWRNQLILRTRQIARVLDLPVSTLRDHLRKLEALEVIRIDEPVPRIKVVTILLAYDYGPRGERAPCVCRAPSVVDLRADRDQTEYVSPQESEIKTPCNDLQLSYTEDSRLGDSENRNKLVMREGLRGSDLHDHIPDLAAMLKEKTPSITDEQARAEAESLLLGDDDS